MFFGTAKPKTLKIADILKCAADPMLKQLFYVEHALREARAAKELLALKPVYEPCVFRDEREVFRVNYRRTHWLDRMLTLFEDAGEFRRAKAVSFEELAKLSSESRKI